MNNYQLSEGRRGFQVREGARFPTEACDGRSPCPIALLRRGCKREVSAPCLYAPCSLDRSDKGATKNRRSASRERLTLDLISKIIGFGSRGGRILYIQVLKLRTSTLQVGCMLGSTLVTFLSGRVRKRGCDLNLIQVPECPVLFPHFMTPVARINEQSYSIFFSP